MFCIDNDYRNNLHHFRKKMRKNIMSRLLSAVAVCAVMAAATSCSTPKDVTYFQDATPETVISMAQAQPIVARPGDKLVILVTTKDPKVSALFNLPTYSTRIEEPSQLGGQVISNTSVPESAQGVASYTVSPEGYIDFPVLGKLKIEGMSRQEIAGYIKGELMGRDLVKDPTITVEFLNTGVNILGMVKTPGRYEINRDQFTVTDAIALAGDVSLNGMRNNIKVIRKENGKAKTYLIDLTNMEQTMNSPAYYLRQEDIIYVEPNEITKRATIANGNNATNVSFWISLASLLTTVATTIGVFVNK